ncbi:MFS transporter [Candidatus Methanomethylophilus sp. 1R26]|uniref:MFS transporter n=1 Tax=Candidatus Methanomethylophilus sp. 1R26 TaxID=1769296 RepID=UPI000737A9FA|nr:MFS transporter [Candidatus Methanomethylophilus sp. 1R26]KUE73197.1 MFS transporter [Candidatus Methanomethylophilus sp. 1R26]
MPNEDGVSSAAARYGIATFAILAAAYFLVYFHRTTGGALSETFADRYGVGPSAVALLASTYLIAYTAMQIPSGMLTDRWGPRRTATAAVSFIAAGSAMTAASDWTGEFMLMVIGRFVIGFGAASVFIPMMRVLAVWFRRDRFATMNGIILLIGNIGAIAAATPMYEMTDALGIGEAYILLAAVTVMVAACCWVIVRDSPGERGLGSLDAGAEERVPARRAIATVLGGRMRFWPLAASMFFFFGTMMMWQASQAGSFYTNVYGYGEHDASVMVMMVGIGSLFGCPVGGLLSDRVLRSRKTVAMIGTGGYAAAWAVMWLTAGRSAFSSEMFQASLNFLFGFFSGFLVATVAQIKECFPSSLSAMSVACMHTFTFIGGALAVATCGFVVADSTVSEFQALCLIAAAMAFLSFVCEALSVEDGPDDGLSGDPAVGYLVYLSETDGSGTLRRRRGRTQGQ